MKEFCSSKKDADNTRVVYFSTSNKIFRNKKKTMIEKKIGKKIQFWGLKDPISLGFLLYKFYFGSFYRRCFQNVIRKCWSSLKHAVFAFMLEFFGEFLKFLSCMWIKSSSCCTKNTFLMLSEFRKILL